VDYMCSITRNAALIDGSRESVRLQPVHYSCGVTNPSTNRMQDQPHLRFATIGVLQ
jgi:hypothetical protein